MNLQIQCPSHHARGPVWGTGGGQSFRLIPTDLLPRCVCVRVFMILPTDLGGRSWFSSLYICLCMCVCVCVCLLEEFVIESPVGVCTHGCMCVCVCVLRGIQERPPPANEEQISAPTLSKHTPPEPSTLLFFPPRERMTDCLYQHTTPRLTLAATFKGVTRCGGT